MSNQNRDAKRAALLQLGAEYGNLSDRKLAQWLDMLAYAEPEDVERAVSALMIQPDRQFLPHIGEIANLCPQRGQTLGHLCWFDWTCGEPSDCGCPWDDVPTKRRQSIADSAYRSFTGQLDRSAKPGALDMTRAQRAWLLKVDPEVFNRHQGQQQSLSLQAVGEPIDAEFAEATA